MEICLSLSTILPVSCDAGLHLLNKKNVLLRKTWKKNTGNIIKQQK